MENSVLHLLQQASIAVQTDAPASSFLSFSQPPTSAGFFFFLHILDPTRVKESIIYNISIIIQYVVDVVHRDEMKDKSSASVSKYKV